MDMLAAYRAFVLVADHGGFSAAARASGQSQSAVSRQVADLETHLGASMFRRTTRRVALTPDGERLIGKAREVIGLVAEAERSVGTRAQTLGGHIRLAAPAALGHVLVAPALCAFLARHPDLDGEIRTLRDRGAALSLVDDIDLAIEIGPVPARLGERRKLGDVPLVLCAGPMLVRDHGAPKTVDDLARLPTIESAPAGSRIAPWRLERGAEHREVSPATRLRCDNLEALRSAVLENAGIALAPLWLVHHEIASGRLWRLLPQWHGGLQPILAGPIGDAPLGPEANGFVDFLADSMGRQRLFV